MRGGGGGAAVEGFRSLLRTLDAIKKELCNLEHIEEYFYLSIKSPHSYTFLRSLFHLDKSLRVKEPRMDSKPVLNSFNGVLVVMKTASFESLFEFKKKKKV